MNKLLRLLFASLLLWSVGPAHAAAPAASQTPFVVPAVPALGVHSYVLLDARTGQVIAQQNASARQAPGGAAKLMVAYVVFQELQAGRIALDSRLRVSRVAWHEPGARMFLSPGSEVTVNDLLQGLLVDGGNDAAATLAQGIAGTRSSFVSLMNADAHNLGLGNTHYSNVTGLPAPGLYTSAMDMAKLSRALLTQFPQYAHYFTQKRFTWDGITQYNFDKLLWRDAHSEGLEPGYADRAAGFCMAAAARHGHTQLIAAVMGMAPQKGASLDQNLNALARVSEVLLNYGFSFYTTRELYKAGAKVGELRVNGGAQRKLAVGLAHALYVTLPRGEYSALAAKAEFSGTPAAPVAKGQKLGEMVVRLHGKTLATAPVVALQSVPRGNLWQRLKNAALDWLHSQKA
ncbi:D-alanyl-D-alanine carboxypeptidase family protein [Acidihalobacter ferrooxydans]|uniref:serine-type D-Ala-D-Ala carboxypeptidase n=1 Tax=Acidihalobacter ferrooxydans TaxID=1765967 RepID=A0A1P8UJV7_9GAMM|nr:D-alanyl-D-alanine carboxypeptidase family protein [Acidihalobacter ferrooxydans]APZ44116.1 hypothetical protein BW247_14280 [Acidihalobacter ferrooxydans]